MTRATLLRSKQRKNSHPKRGACEESGVTLSNEINLSVIDPKSLTFVVKRISGAMKDETLNSTHDSKRDWWSERFFRLFIFFFFLLSSVSFHCTFLLALFYIFLSFFCKEKGALIFVHAVSARARDRERWNIINESDITHKFTVSSDDTVVDKCVQSFVKTIWLFPREMASLRRSLLLSPSVIRLLSLLFFSSLSPPCSLVSLPLQ